MPVQIDPATGERVQVSGTASIDPNTGERLAVPRATMSAAPTGAVPWLEDAESDLRRGGSRTAVGRTLGFMQGRGDKGYTGLQSESSPEAADFMGSVPLGLTKMAKGGAEVGTGKPWQGTKDIVGGGMQAATIPSSFMGGPAADAAITSIPSRMHAGAMINDITEAAGHIPVDLKNTMSPLLRGVELGERGGTPSKPVSDLWTRANEIAAPTFREARDYYTNISQKSADEANALKPNMKAQIGAIRKAFHGDLTDAAGMVGRGEDYAKAIREYAQAAKAARIANNIGKIALPLVAGGAGLGGALQLLKKFSQ